VRAALGSDKKRLRGRQRWILPMDVGRVTEVDDVTDAELERAIATILDTAPAGGAGREGDRGSVR
jgi:3-dehydroquinate synthetase